jgi:ABC-type uncharacterized transport system substrate-binding protein
MLNTRCLQMRSDAAHRKLGSVPMAARLSHILPILGALLAASVQVAAAQAAAPLDHEKVEAFVDGAVQEAMRADKTLIPRIVALAVQNRMPTIYGFSTAVRQGGLMSYSADTFELWRRAADYIDRILKGANPGDLPIEQTTAIKFAINPKTAKALGIDIPPTMLAAANEGIE